MSSPIYSSSTVRDAVDIKRLALVAMPWSTLTRPSAALGALAPYVRSQLPEVEVTCVSEFITAGLALGQMLYEGVAGRADGGEMLYAQFLYPDRAAQVETWFSRWWPKRQVSTPTDVAWQRLQEVLPVHLESAAQRLAAANYDAIGLTTCFGQLFANLALARRLKELAPHTIVVLGGSTVSSRTGPSILAEYPWVDYVIQGEGEQPLTALLRKLRGGRPGPQPAAVLSQQNHRVPRQLSEVEQLDRLPFPDYDEYAAKADAAGLDWVLPMEGSRGCWWDRATRTGNPKATCYFCNLNMQWAGYREKSVGRVVEELNTLSKRYDRLHIYFLDNIIRHRDTEEMARQIARTRRDFELFYEMRVNVTPYQLLLLSEAGLHRVQFGIEGLSTSLLKRIGKGTTCIQNLQAMKVCKELGIVHDGNLILNFPGSTQAELTETLDVIRRFAIIYAPLQTSRFSLGVDSTVERLPQEFGVRNLRNSDDLREVLPEPVLERLEYVFLSYDSDDISWAEIDTVCDAWRARHDKQREPLLSYRDGQTFLEIIDRRLVLRPDDCHRSYTLRGLVRRVYLACMEITSDESLKAQFCRSSITPSEVDAAISGLLELDVLYAENGRFLSLAVADNPRIAARRIRAAHRRRPAASPPSRPLPSPAPVVQRV